MAAFAVVLALLLSLNVLSVTIAPSFGWYLFCGFCMALSIIAPGMSFSTLLMPLGLYTPLVEREAYVEEESRSFLERLHGGSLSSLVAALCPDTRLTEEDVAALERILGKEEG